jgi:hypothetical protein
VPREFAAGEAEFPAEGRGYRYRPSAAILGPKAYPTDPVPVTPRRVIVVTRTPAAPSLAPGAAMRSEASGAPESRPDAQGEVWDRTSARRSPSAKGLARYPAAPRSAARRARSSAALMRMTGAFAPARSR